MQYSKHKTINAWIDTLHQLIMTTIPSVKMQEQPGFRSNNYLLGTSMKDIVCYIICYDEKANLGFSQGVELTKEFPSLKGTGKTHRHITIDETFMKDLPSLTKLIKKAFAIKK